MLALAPSACGDDGEDLVTVGSGGSGGSGGSAGSDGAGAAGTSNGTPIGGSGGVSGGGEGGNGGSSGEQAGTGVCNARVVESPPTSFEHLTPLCTPVSYDTNPPSGGPHYAVWPAYQSYDFPLPAGVLVHALEHGTIVFWYNCPEGCPEEVAEVEAFIAQQPEDPLCDGTPAARRAILVPYPELASRWAASAWGFALSADCFDPEAFGAFYTDHYGRGREVTCSSGPAYTETPCP